MAVILTRSPNNKIDVKLAAELRANGATWDTVAKLTGASSGDAVRQAMGRRGVNVAIRTTINKVSTERAKEAIAQQSEDTRAALSTTVLEQSQALSKIKIKPNLRNIKALGQAIEPLARTAKIVHGWGESKAQALVSVQVLGDVRLDDMFKEQEAIDTTSSSVPALPGPGELPPSA